MQIINIIVLGVISRILGGAWDNEIPRRYILPPLFAYILYATDFDLVQFGAIVWLFAVARLLPTNALFTAVHGHFPTREDGRWQFLRTITDYIAPKNSTNKQWAIAYGVVRNMLALPAIIYLGGFAYLLLAQGLIYWLCGKISSKYGSKAAEVLTGAIIGLTII